MERTKENVIFLAMSTMKFKVAISNYYMRENGKVYYYNGYSQLEPGTKHFLNKLAEKGKRVDRIVIIGSDKVCNDRITEEWMAAVEDAQTAETVYEKRIWEYIKDRQDHGMNYPSSDPAKEEQWRKERPEAIELCAVRQTVFQGIPLYPEDTAPEDFFICINPEAENRRETYLWDILKAIKGNGQSDIRLFMDMQGGDRNAVFEMNAVVEMLKDQNVEICGRVATKFENSKILNELHEVSGYYREYELLTAAQIFKRYGWGRELSQFFASGKNMRDKAFADVIQAASNAIKMCDVDGFDRTLLTISTLIKERSAQSGQRTKLDLILADIQEDYTEDLLDVDINRPLRYVRQIEWCLRKNFIQQALTILESKMPTEYIRCGLRYYCEDEGEIPQRLQDFEAIYAIKKEAKQGYRLKDVNHYFISDHPWDREKVSDIPDIPILTAFTGSEEETKKFEDEVKNSIKTYKDLQRIRNTSNHAASTYIHPHATVENNFFIYMQERHKGDRMWEITRTNEAKIINKIHDYLRKFEALYARTDKEKVSKIIDLA